MSTLITVLHEPTCTRDFAPCTCGMYAIDENFQCLGAFTLNANEISDLLTNDSIGG